MIGWTSEPTFTFVEAKKTGDGREAVFEKSTDEPIQYVTNPDGKVKLLARWEASLSGARDAASRRAATR